MNVGQEAHITAGWEASATLSAEITERVARHESGVRYATDGSPASAMAISSAGYS